MPDIEEGTAGKELTIDTPIAKVGIKGYHLGNALQFLQIALVAFLCFLIWQQKEALGTAASTAAVTSKAEHENISKVVINQTAAIDRQTEAQSETTYILTLNQVQRERLNMQMPGSLRRRVIGRDQ